MTSATLAMIILAAILLQIVVALLLNLRRRTRGVPPETAREVSPKLPPQPTTVPQPGSAWEGFREFVVQRREYEDDNREICSFYLVPADGLPLPPFRPGQFLTFRLQIEDPVSGEKRSLVRCYSLSDAPRAEHYRISVKQVAPLPDRPELPPGVVSNFLHQRVAEGSRVQVRAPSGHFHLQEGDRPLVLIAGGIGITPMLSILLSLLQTGSQRDIWLYYGVRHGGEVAMASQLRELAAHHDNFHLHLCFSAPRETEREGVDYQHHGRVDIPLLRATLRLAPYEFYVCGPRPMMESLVPALEEWGVDSADIHYESFGPATLSRASKEIVLSGSATVTFGRSGRRLPWDPAAESLLVFAEAHGVDVNSGCRAGSCGSCRTGLIAGEVIYRQDPDAEVDAGHCLLCISVPKGDLTLDA